MLTASRVDVLGVELRDITAGFRAYQAEAVRTIASTRSTATGTSSRSRWPTASSVGWHRVEVPITFRDCTRATEDVVHVVGEAIRPVTWWGFRDRVLHPEEGVAAAEGGRRSVASERAHVRTTHPPGASRGSRWEASLPSRHPPYATTGGAARFSPCSAGPS